MVRSILISCDHGVYPVYRTSWPLVVSPLIGKPAVAAATPPQQRQSLPVPAQREQDKGRADQGEAGTAPYCRRQTPFAAAGGAVVPTVGRQSVGRPMRSGRRHGRQADVPRMRWAKTDRRRVPPGQVGAAGGARPFQGPCQLNGDWPVYI